MTNKGIDLMKQIRIFKAAYCCHSKKTILLAQTKEGTVTVKGPYCLQTKEGTVIVKRPYCVQTKEGTLLSKTDLSVPKEAITKAGFFQGTRKLHITTHYPKIIIITCISTCSSLPETL